MDDIERGAWLRSLREERGLRQEDVARRLGVSDAYVSHLEKGVRRHRIDLIEDYAEALGMRLVYDIVPAGESSPLMDRETLELAWALRDLVDGKVDDLLSLARDWRAVPEIARTNILDQVRAWAKSADQSDNERVTG